MDSMYNRQAIVSFHVNGLLPCLSIVIYSQLESPYTKPNEPKCIRYGAMLVGGPGENMLHTSPSLRRGGWGKNY